ncbi:MAG: Uroporphyrinogen deCOase protein [Acidobacteriota bacterium]|nr:Uroporphyrinogen deCOase protein [Acidobacteriota bacterium]
MTPKERMVGLIQGKEIDLVPFVQYHNLNAKDVEIWEMFGKDKMGVLKWVQAYRIETPHCKFVHKIIRDGKLFGWQDTLITPKGNLIQKRFRIPHLDETAIVEHFIKKIDDYHILLAYLRDFHIVEDLTQIQQCHKMLGEGGIPHVCLPRTPFQSLWIEWVSLEDFVIHLFCDDPGLLNEVMQLLGEILLHALKVTTDAIGKVEFYHVVIADNIHAPVIGKQLFQEWCIPYYNTISDILREKGLPFLVHMDGDLRALWDEIDTCRIRGFDSLSPPPDNDTSVSEALSRWPGKMVWANFPSSVHLDTQEDIYNMSLELLKQGGHTRRFWIQISENVPPGVWRKSFPPIIQAIEDFGKP